MTTSRLQNVWLTRIILIAVLLLAAWIGMHGANSDSLWVDEYWSMYHAGGAFLGTLSLPDVWNRVASQDPWQAPLYYMLLNQWGALVGWSEFAARLLSLFTGMISIAATYRLGRDLFSRSVGTAAAVLLGTSAYTLYFFHEMRSYTLYLLFTPLMIWAYWRLITRKESIGAYGLLFLSIVGALYTHYFAALTAVAIGVFHVIALPLGGFKGRAGVWWRINGLFVLALIAFLPWFAVFWAGLAEASAQSGARGINALTPFSAVQGVLYLFSNGTVSVVLLLIGLSITRRRKRLTVITWAWFLFVLALLLLINARFGVLLEVRYMFVLWIPLALLCALGIERLYRDHPKWAAVAIGVWVIGGVWASFDPSARVSLSNPHWHLPWRELRAELEPRAVDGDAALFLLPDWTWAVYHTDTQGYYLHGLPVRAALIEQPEHFGTAHYVEWAGEALDGATRAWIAADPTQPLNHRDDIELILTSLAFRHCGTLTQYQDALTLDLFARHPDSTPIRFGTSPFIEVSALTPLPETVTDALHLSEFFVLTDTAWAAQFSIGFHVENARGDLVAQADLSLPTDLTACRLIDLPLDTLPDGAYTVLMTIYNSQTGERLPLTDPNQPGAQPDHRVQLGVIRLDRLVD